MTNGGKQFFVIALCQHLCQVFGDGYIVVQKLGPFTARKLAKHGKRRGNSVIRVRKAAFCVRDNESCGERKAARKPLN